MSDDEKPVSRQVRRQMERLQNKLTVAPLPVYYAQRREHVRPRGVFYKFRGKS